MFLRTILTHKRHLAAALTLASLPLMSPLAEARDSFKVCWSIYAGWMPWGYAESEGIVKKWADKYDIDIDVVQLNDYVESINQYTAGNFDGCSMTNMDALTIPAASGIDTTALIVGDYSNGNDGVALKGTDNLRDIEGRKVNLVQFSVSHYLLARALDSVGMTERDLKTVNTSDADIVGLANNSDVNAVVTWNPQLSEVAKLPNYHVVFDSSQIPGEILDLMVVNTDTLKAHPELGQALVGAWYETLSKMEEGAPNRNQVLTQMAKAAGTDLAGYQHQLAATHLFYQPREAVSFTQNEKLLDTMQHVAEFSFDHGLLGEGAPDATFVGVQTPAGTYGDKQNVKLRFDPSYTEQYAQSQQ